ncbi:MAG TPA: lipocalin-like domain-containing protein [Thermoanaerobaculia bacterium]|jgi:predicted secreted hydrolase
MTAILAALAALLLAPAAPAPTAPVPGLRFPRDHGSHADAAVEWWYYTGHLADPAGRAYGFQLTFFRAGTLHLAHFAWTDVAAKTFRYEEKTHLELPGIASADAGRLRVRNENWSAEEADGVHRLRANGPEGALDLTLRAVKAPVAHGPGGVSKKGAGAAEYSHYVSITRLDASGAIARGGKRVSLAGSAWFDHEWGPGALPSGVAGWDWFGVQLSDGSELMLYRLREPDGRATAFSSGTFVPPSGPPAPVAWNGVELEETKRWTSPRTQAAYPAGWRIALSPLRLALEINPLLPDQELVTEKSTGVTYWEGACRVTGTRGGKPVTGGAYVELTGYAGRDVPGFTAPPTSSSPGAPSSR